jgi:hypothetical protein
MIADITPQRGTLMNQTYDYDYRLAVPGGHATCRLRVFAEGDDIARLATEVHDRFGGTILADRSAALAAYAEGYHHPARAVGHCTWVEQDDYTRDSEHHGARETFATVAFQRGPDGALITPLRTSSNRAAIETLIGQPVGV